MKTSVNTFVILAAVLSASGIGSAAELREIDGREWEDLTRMSVGREETRASFAPFGDFYQSGDKENAPLQKPPLRSIC